MPFTYSGRKDFYLKEPVKDLTGEPSLRTHRIRVVCDVISKHKGSVNRLLDIGCGDGEITLIIAKALKCNDVYGVDISPDAVRLAREKGIKAYQLDVEENDLPFDDSSFDMVYCGELIEHVFNPDGILREIYRVLKINGFAVITTPNLACWYNRVFLFLGYQPFHYSATLENYDAGCFPLARKGSVSERAHVRTMTYKAFKELLKRHKFRIIRMKGAGTETKNRTVDSLNRIISIFPSLASYLIALVEKR